MTTAQTRRYFLYAMIAVILPIEIPTTLAADKSMTDFFLALAQVESGHDDTATGDSGASIGRYQIQRAYWQDATDHDPSIGGRYEDCRDKAYAERIMLAYWDRYARKALRERDWQTLARCHNAGWNWKKKIKATDGYWEKVQKALDGGR